MGQPPNGDSETDTESIIDDGKVIVRGSEQDEFPEEFWQEIEAGKPSEWSVMKEVCAVTDTCRGLIIIRSVRVRSDDIIGGMVF